MGASFAWLPGHEFGSRCGAYAGFLREPWPHSYWNARPWLDRPWTLRCRHALPGGSSVAVTLIPVMRRRHRIGQVAQRRRVEASSGPFLLLGFDGTRTSGNAFHRASGEARQSSGRLMAAFIGPESGGTVGEMALASPGLGVPVGRKCSPVCIGRACSTPRECREALRSRSQEPGSSNWVRYPADHQLEGVVMGADSDAPNADSRAATKFRVR